jgi:hypothetical protein
MRLDEGGEATTVAELLERFAGRSWLYELDAALKSADVSALGRQQLELGPSNPRDLS